MRKFVSALVGGLVIGTSVLTGCTSTVKSQHGTYATAYDPVEMAGYIESQPQYKYAEWGSLTCPPNPDATKGTDIVCHADGMQVDKASSHGEDILVTITSYNMDFNWTYTQSGPDTGVNK